MSDNNQKFKCIPQNLSMSESAPVCQPWSYASSHPMKAMLDSRYFLSAYDRLRPGDTIRIIQMKAQNIHARDNEVISFADALILKTGKLSIDMHIEKRTNLAEMTKDVEENEEEPVVKWNPGKGEHQAVVGEGDDLEVLFSHKDKKEVAKWLRKSESSTAPEGK